jgi:hypothetical protein
MDPRFSCQFRKGILRLNIASGAKTMGGGMAVLCPLKGIPFRGVVNTLEMFGCWWRWLLNGGFGVGWVGFDPA